MKINLDLFSNPFTCSTITESLPSKPESEKLDLNSAKKSQTRKVKDFYFINFWNKLILAPGGFSSGPNTPIQTIVEQQIDISPVELISTVLSGKFGFPLNSALLSNAVKDARKIYHEDHPYNFVLEYNGERLGMVVLDFCSISNKEASPQYRFNTNIKSFKGI